MLKKIKENLSVISILIAGVLVAGAVLFVGLGKSSLTKGEILSPQAAAEKVINFINSDILRGMSAASLINVSEENNLYKLKFTIQDQEIEAYITRDGNILFPEAIDLRKFQSGSAPAEQTIGNFSVSQDEICKENNKPLVYFFGSETCPYCLWQHPIVEKVMAKFNDNIIFHDNMDSEADMDILQKYSAGGVPTLVLGCKYYRTGSGEFLGEEEEIRVLTALTCQLTGSQPADICNQVQDLIDQI